MVRYSIVILNLNGMKHLSPCIDSIHNQDFTDYEIIIVDNASTDTSVTFLEENYPDVLLVRNATNRGFAGGCNDGAEIASGEYLFFLNNDTVLSSSFFSHLEHAIQKYPDYGMYAPKMIYPDGRINSTGIFISLSGAVWDRGLKEQDTYGTSDEVFGPCGGAAVYTREVFFQAGRFDEDFFIFMEDADLAFRTHLLGWKCRFIPEASVIHHHGGTVGVGSDFSVYYGNRNIIWFPLKNFPFRILFFSLPLIIIRALVTVFYYSCSGRGKLVLCAKWDAVKGIPSLLRKRKGIHQNKKTDFGIKYNLK